MKTTKNITKRYLKETIDLDQWGSYLSIHCNDEDYRILFHVYSENLTDYNILSFSLNDLESLVKRCYEIQKKYQYEPERNNPLVLMQKHIDEVISEKGEKGNRRRNK